MQKAHNPHRGQKAKISVFIALTCLLVAAGCSDVAEKAQTSITDSIEHTTTEASQDFNERKNRMLQDLLDDLKKKTNIPITDKATNQEEQ